MKKIIYQNLSTLLALIFTLICYSSFAVPEPPIWQKLGTRVVNHKLDRDEIPVTLRLGVYDSVKLLVKRSPINLHRFVIHFANGGKQEVRVRKCIPKGGETRLIDLKAGNRVIRKVVFWYDTKGLVSSNGVVELWGRS